VVWLCERCEAGRRLGSMHAARYPSEVNKSSRVQQSQCGARRSQPHALPGVLFFLHGAALMRLYLAMSAARVLLDPLFCKVRTAKPSAGARRARFSPRCKNSCALGMAGFPKRIVQATGRTSAGGRDQAMARKARALEKAKENATSGRTFPRATVVSVHLAGKSRVRSQVLGT
jgi:hypothetical protein